MTTARYIVSSVNAANGSFLDLGIQGRGLTDTGAARDITYVDSEATNPAAIQRVYYRAGMSLNMAASTVSGSNYVVYLDGASTDYTINAATGTITLTSDTTQVLTVRMEATTTVVFSDGQVAGNALAAAVSGSGSLGYSGTAGAAQNLRILTGDSAGEAFSIVRSGTTLTANGHRGVDALYVEEGGAADATRLGGGKDVVYLTSNFADYTLSVRGLTLVLQHNTNASETVYLAMGVAGAATDDRLVFADGAVDTSEIREAYINNSGGANSFAGITTLAHIGTQAARIVTSVDTAVTTALYTPATPAAPTLTTDTGTAADGITSNGAISVGARGANADVSDVLQFSTDGGTSFQNVPGGGLTLAGQVSGATGVTYAAGDVQLRSVSASGVVSAVSSNASAIVVDNATATPTTTSPTTSVDVSGMGDNARYILFRKTSGAAGAVESHLTLDYLSVINAADGTTDIIQGLTLSYGATTATTTTAGQVFFGHGAIANVKWASSAAATTLQSDENGVGSGWVGSDASTASTDQWILIDLGQEYGIGSVTVGPRIASQISNTEIILLRASALDFSGGTVAAVVGGTTVATYQQTVGVSTTNTGSITNTVDVTFAASMFTHPVSGVAPETGFSGTGAEASATITVTATNDGNAADVRTGTTTANADGTWTVTALDGFLTDGATYTVTTTATDVAGNIDSLAASVSVTATNEIPAPPVMATASDTGVNTSDEITNDTTPTFTGTLRLGTTVGVTVAIIIDTVQQTSTTVPAVGAVSTSADGSLVVTSDASGNLSWTFTPAAALTGSSAGTFGAIQISVGGAASSILPYVIDTGAVAPTITSTVPTAVTTASGDLVLSGTAESGSTAVNVTLTDSTAGTALTDTNAATVTQNIDGTTSWSVTFTAAELAALTDGTVTLSIASTDRAGNPGALAANPTFTLELVNGAPVANSGMTDASLARTISVNTTGTILDLLDTDANVLTTGTVDDAFTDADAVGSANGTVTYSGQLITSLGADAAVGGGDDVYGALPAWLEVTAAGVVQVVAGQVPLAGVYNLHLTATDGAATPLSATRDVQLTVSAGVALNTALGINQATAATVSDFDLRSDIVFTATGNLTAVTGNSITLHNQADGAVTTGDIVIDAAAAGVVLSYNAGTDITSIRINPGFDLDVNATYTLSVAAGAFTDASSGSSLAFSTVFASVDPNGADNVAQQFAAGASALSAGATWVDITANGNGASETLAGTTDASTGATVIYAGAATVNAANSFDVNANYFTSVTGFGADDLIYFDDQANGANYGLVSNFDAALSFLQSDSTGDTLAAAPDRNFLGMSGVDGLTQSPTLLVQLAGATTMATSVHGLGANSMETLLGVTPAAVMVA